MKTNPIELFNEWYEKAITTETDVPDAMSLATVDDRGRPHVRMVLLKQFDKDGFVFYTNLESPKSQQIKIQSAVALCFHWKSQKRQVRIEGFTQPTSAEEADSYFASRPRASKLGAWASKQSQPLASRFDLEKRLAHYTAQFHLGEISRPSFWSGYRVKPERIEFWEEKPFRLHDRFVYELKADDTSQVWVCTDLFP
jgi:pyridoxamine 5'-phosphate oxidase